jgi:hypothetical protein
MKRAADLSAARFFSFSGVRTNEKTAHWGGPSRSDLAYIKGLTSLGLSHWA